LAAVDTPIIVVVDSSNLHTIPRGAMRGHHFTLYVHSDFVGMPRELVQRTVFQATYNVPAVSCHRIQKKLFRRIPRHEFREVTKALGSQQKVMFQTRKGYLKADWHASTFYL
jgi:hypothetical protein